MGKYLIYFSIFFTIVACHQHEENHTHKETKVNGNISHVDEDELSLTREQIENIGVQYESINNRYLKTTAKINGRVELLPGGIAVASSPLEGQIRDVKIIPGEFVNKGQVLFTIVNMELIEWQEKRIKAKADLEFIESEIERQKELTENNIAPLRNLQSLETDKKKILASLQALKSKLKLVGVQVDKIEGITSTFAILAPQSGVVQHINVHTGNYINPQTELVEIINDNHLRIHLFAYGNDIQKLSRGQDIMFFVQSRPHQIRNAKIAWINNIVNEENNSYEVHADIEGELKSFSPGEFVEAQVISREISLPSLSTNAISYDKGLPYIFAKVDEGDDETHFKKYLIKTGESDLGFIEIQAVDPLPENGQFVTEGAFFLMAQSKKGSDSGGHSH